jgi:hypothetical protein
VVVRPGTRHGCGHLGGGAGPQTVDPARYRIAVATDTDPIFGLGQYRWTLPLRPEVAEDLKTWLAEMPVAGHGFRSRFRSTPTLVRRRGADGSDHLQLAKPFGASERLHLDVDSGNLHVTQTVPPGLRLYYTLFASLFYLLGLGGLIGAVTGQPGALALLIFPAFLRAVVIPMIRRQARSDLLAVLGDQYLTRRKTP